MSMLTPGNDFGSGGYPWSRQGPVSDEELHALGNYVVACNNGFRCWMLGPAVQGDLADSALRLTSVSQHYVWTPGINHAQCLLTETQRALRVAKKIAFCDHPTTRCMCGFYAYYHTDHWLRPQTWHKQRWPIITGVIEGFGRCVIGDRGFRAEHAIITGLLLPSAGQLAERWVGERDPDECSAIVHDVLSERYPNVPLYDTAEALFANTPLDGRPDRA